ncbi:hypothetical protein AL755_08145 [Arthrobacter sp. ERGS1:01]|nr:hypothetical protein AL755_08145 [Arthrobacter sp. ERGS1:01]
MPEAVADAGNGDDEASTGAPGTDAPETEADSDGAPAAVDHETTNDDPAVAVPDATPTVTVIAGPAAPDVDVLGLKVPAASTDPAFTGAVQTITPVTTGPIPAQPASAPGAFPMPTNTAGPKPVTEPVQTADAALVQEAAVPPVPEVPPLPEVPPVPEAAPGWEPPTAGAPTGSPRRQREDGPEPAAALTSDRLLNKVAAPPVAGWRRWLYTLTFGTVNLGDSDKVRLERARENVIASRLGDHTRFVPVLSRKGGVGKTTVTTLLGMVLADIREDRVIAMDANPDRGTLSDRSPGSADFTARNLVRDRFTVTTFSQLSDYVARDGSRLDVLASDTDPAIAQAFDDSDYRAVTDILSKYYSVVLTDSGTGMVHSVMKGTLEKADAVVLVSGGSVDEARLASETLSWLEAHGRHDLVSNATVVINMSGGETQVDIDQIEEHFKSRVRNVLRIPYDKHLAEGSRVELAKLRPATLAAVKELASLVVTELQKGQPRKG